MQYFGKQPDSYWHFLKGTEGWTGVIMVVLMTIAYTLAIPRPGGFRLRDRFNLFNPSYRPLIGPKSFWYSHSLFLIVYAMLIVHGIKLYLTKEWHKRTVSFLFSFSFLFFLSVFFFFDCLEHNIFVCGNDRLGCT